MNQMETRANGCKWVVRRSGANGCKNVALDVWSYCSKLVGLVG